MAATRGSLSVPGFSLQTLSESVQHCLSNPAAGVAIPVMSTKCPPADPPWSTTRLGSKLYFFALAKTQCKAQRQSSTAAGASETWAIRYSTFTAANPICSAAKVAASGLAAVWAKENEDSTNNTTSSLRIQDSSLETSSLLQDGE